MRGAVQRMVGRRAVEQDPRPHPRGAGGGQARAVAQRRRAVGDRAIAGQIARRGFERGERRRDASVVGGVGIGEVGHQRDLADLRQRVEAQPRRAQALGREAEPVHAAVHLQEDVLRPAGLERREQIDLGTAMDDVPEMQSGAGLEIAAIERAFEQQDRAAPAELAQQHSFGDVEQGEAVGALQRGIDIGDAVTVGVGLDDGPDLGAGSGRASDGEVGGEGVAMNQRFDRPRHGGILPAAPLVRTHRCVRKPACYKPRRRETSRTQVPIR